MTTTPASPAPSTTRPSAAPPSTTPPSGVEPRAARATGLAYLALGIAGMTGFLVIRQQLHVPEDAAATLANLVEREALARVGVAVDLAIVASQALAAVAFRRLLDPISPTAAHAVAAFGMVNAVAILIGTALTWTALDVAVAGGGGADAAATVGLLYQLSDAAWGVGALFFGLWLIPMGLAVRSAGPRLLGPLLVAGGVGYVASVAVGALAPSATLAAELTTAPATVAELWMIGWLLVRGFGRASREVAGTVRA